VNGFVGRKAELERLDTLLQKVSSGVSEPGRAIAIRGRRRVGKSRLVTEFLRRAKVPYVYFTAEHAPLAQELANLETEIARSNLPDRDLYHAGNSWSTALRGLATVIPKDKPTVIVIDEVPYLTRGDQNFEGALQAAWDRLLSQYPVMLILIGSNRAEMERLTSYDRPFYMRGTEMELGPLGVADVAKMTGLPAAEAIDAFLISGGLPMILAEWDKGASVTSFLKQAVSDPLSALLVSGERALTAEFPEAANTIPVLKAIGSGETTFSRIANRSGLADSTLNRSLKILEDRRLIVAEQPLSPVPAHKLTRYRIEDPYLRFWLAFLADQIKTVESGRAEYVLESIAQSWNAWRGKAVEPVVRELLWYSEIPLLKNTRVIGSWWNRANSTEVDLVGLDSGSGTKNVTFIGSIKWRERNPFGVSDLANLIQARHLVPGATDAGLLAVSRSGFHVESTDLLTISPELLIKP